VYEKFLTHTTTEASSVAGFYYGFDSEYIYDCILSFQYMHFRCLGWQCGNSSSEKKLGEMGINPKQNMSESIEGSSTTKYAK